MIFVLIIIFYDKIYIFDSDLVWRMQLMIIKLNVKNSCCVWREFLFLMLINRILHIKSESDLFLYKSLNRTFKISFWVQNHRLNLFSSAVKSQKVYVYKKLLWNIRIKAFCYTIDILTQIYFWINLSKERLNQIFEFKILLFTKVILFSIKTGVKCSSGIPT